MRVTYITTCTNILIILQNIFAADGALYILWSTADIKDVKIWRNSLYCKVTFHFQCIPLRQSVIVAGLLLNIQHKYMKNMAGTSDSIIFYLYFTSKEIKSSLKINYLCLNSRYVQVFLSVSQNTFSLIGWFQTTTITESRRKALRRKP